MGLKKEEWMGCSGSEGSKQGNGSDKAACVQRACICPVIDDTAYVLA